MRKNLLITALPGAGKTTVLRRVAETLGGPHVRGFLTDELREGGERVGFRIQTLSGQTATLAHLRLRAVHRVGRYHVELGALERVAVAALIPAGDAKVFLVDEIGKMECLSARFVSAVERLLDGAAPVVATVAQRGSGLISRVKRRPDAETWEVTHLNRDSLPAAVLQWLAERGVDASR